MTAPATDARQDGLLPNPTHQPWRSQRKAARRAAVSVPA
jgi:hypothetical protein